MNECMIEWNKMGIGKMIQMVIAVLENEWNARILKMFFFPPIWLIAVMEWLKQCCWNFWLQPWNVTSFWGEQKFQMLRIRTHNIVGLRPWFHDNNPTISRVLIKFRSLTRVLFPWLKMLRKLEPLVSFPDQVSVMDDYIGKKVICACCNAPARKKKDTVSRFGPTLWSISHPSLAGVDVFILISCKGVGFELDPTCVLARP